MMEVLYKNIGKEFSQDMLGCVMPLYLLYPDIPIYEYIENPEYFLHLVSEYFTEISKDELQEGDLVILNKKDAWHFCIYAGNDKVFHCTKTHSLRLSRLSNYLKFEERYYRKCQKL